MKRSSGNTGGTVFFESLAHDSPSDRVNSVRRMLSLFNTCATVGPIRSKRS